MLMRLVILVVFLVLTATSSQALTLEQKAKLFQHDMEKRFLLDGQTLCKLKLPTPSRKFIAYNMPDNAYMTGIYVGTLSMKYAVTGIPEDLATARKSLEALHLLCNVSGVPGVLARAVWPMKKPLEDDGVWRESACGKYRWRGDVSTDQVDGVLFGFSLAYDLIANDEEKSNIARDVKAITDHILANSMRIVDVDGKATEWGRYNPGYVTILEKMNTLLWLQVLKVTAHVSGEKRYDDLYQEWAIEKKYAKIAVRARRNLNPAFPGAINHSDDVLLFLAYVPLLMYETDIQIRNFIVKSIQRSWQGSRYTGVKSEGNPFYAFVMAHFMDDPSGVENAINTLRWFPLDMKWNRNTIENYAQEFNFSLAQTIDSMEPSPGNAIPIDRRIKSWSAWVQDPYHSAGTREKDLPIEFNGHDYLLGYWMGRYYKLISPEE